MAMTYATVTGRIVIPGTTTGIPGELHATPLTEGGVLAFPVEDYTTVGAAVADVTGNGTIEQEGNPGLQIPTDVPPGTLWRLVLHPKGKGNLPVRLGDYEITASTDIADLVPINPTVITPTVATDIAGAHAAALAAAASAATAAEIVGLPTEAAAQAFNIENDPGVRGALSATIAADLDASTEPGGAVWKVGPTPVNVRQYGIDPTNTAAQNDAALTTLFAEETGAVFLAFPDRGTFNFSAPLPARNHLQVSGRGRQTILNWTAGNMLNISGTTLMQSAVFSDVQITNSGTAAHLIDVTGTGGLIHTTFERCNIKPGVNGASILRADTFNLFGIYVRDCLLMRNATATVPAVQIIGQTGAGTNNLHFEGGEWHSYECASSPFFRADTSSGSPIINLTFEKIIGEQNHGGMIHAAGVAVVKVENVIDYDSTTYADDLFRFATSAGGATCNSVDIDQAGSYGSATLGSGKAHLRISSGTAHRVGWIPKSASESGTVIVTPTRGVAVRRAGIEVPPYEAIAALPATMTTSQHTVVVTVAGTITLPSGAATGQRFQVKATGGSGCTVDGGGANIDGAASRVLAQYESMTVAYTGSSWIRL